MLYEIDNNHLFKEYFSDIVEPNFLSRNMPNSITRISVKAFDYHKYEQSKTNEKLPLQKFLMKIYI